MPNRKTLNPWTSEPTCRPSATRAREASRAIAAASSEAKNKALATIAAEIRVRREILLAANASDLEQARAEGLEPALIDRLTLSPAGIEAMAEGLEQIAALPDPVGEMTDIKRRPSGIQVGKMRVPLGSSASSTRPAPTSPRTPRRCA